MGMSSIFVTKRAHEIVEAGRARHEHNLATRARNHRAGISITAPYCHIWHFYDSRSIYSNCTKGQKT